MRSPSRVGRAWAGIAAVALLFGAAPAARAQQIPQWIQDSVNTANRYLMLWQYFRSGEVTKWDLWTVDGNPEDPRDNFRFFFNTQGNLTVPWGTRLFSSPHPPYTDQNPDQRPYANLVTIRVNNVGGTGFTDLAYPGNGTPIFGPPTPPLPQGQGFFAPYLFENGTLEVNQKLQFARDLLRVEFVVRNRGTVRRMVGIRALIDPYVDWWSNFSPLLGYVVAEPCVSIFLPRTRQRLTYETDFGLPTGTTTPPRVVSIPDEWEIFDDEGADPVFVAKGILSGNGATRPTRVVFCNTLNLFPPAGQANGWDYNVDNPMELRISDIGVLIYWDPVDIGPGEQRSFVTYCGMGVASHGMSNAYQLAAALNPSDVQTQGYIGAVQAPFALPLLDGNVDIDLSGSPMTHKVTAYVQNMYHISNLPNAFAFLDLPAGLKLLPETQSQRISLGNLAAVGRSGDEGSGSWQIQATGEDAGILPVTVTFSNGFQDSIRVTRNVNVPQGRRYLLTDDWRMITFPFTFQNLQDDPATVLGLDPGSFQIRRYNPAIGQYEEVSQIQPGEGYWIRMLGLGPTWVRLQNAVPVKIDLASTVALPLQPGWNQVGNASPYAVAVRDIKFRNVGGLIVSFDQAVATNQIRPALFRFDRLTGQYVALNRDSVIAPGQGIWIFSNGERHLLWPPPVGPQISIRP